MCSGLRKSQAKKLAALVCAAASTQCDTLANIGLAVAGTARCKHQIKRDGRFIANERVAVADTKVGVITRLACREDAPFPAASIAAVLEATIHVAPNCGQLG